MLDLRDALTYCPDSGALTWKTALNSMFNGREAGRITRFGYRSIRYNHKDYMAHRVAWLIMTGEWPALSIDHSNLDKADNRWSNLRLATPAQNTANRRAYGKYPKGVSAARKAGRYSALFRFNGQSRYLGTFDSVEAAAAAYAAEAIKHYGEFARVA